MLWLAVLPWPWSQVLGGHARQKAVRPASAHIIYPPQSHFPLGDRGLVTHPSPSAPMIVLLCPAQTKSGPCITAHTIASTHINTYELLCTHTHTHSDYTNIHIKKSKRITPFLSLSVVIAWWNTGGHYTHLNVNTHWCTHRRRSHEHLRDNEQ